MTIPATIEDWRKLIDGIDEEIVRLLNERAKAAQEIGRLKRHSTLPIYEPDRERVVLEHVAHCSHGPLPASELHHIYERIIDVMRSIQRVEIVADGHPTSQTNQQGNEK